MVAGIKSRGAVVDFSGRLTTKSGRKLSAFEIGGVRFKVNGGNPKEIRIRVEEGRGSPISYAEGKRKGLRGEGAIVSVGGEQLREPVVVTAEGMIQ